MKHRFEQRHLHAGARQVDSFGRVEVERVSFAVEVPLARRVEFLEHVLDEEPRLLVHLARIARPLRAHLVPAVTEPDPVRVPVDVPYPPLEVAPVVRLIDVHDRLARSRPPSAGKTRGVEHDSPEGKVIHWSEPEILLYDDDTFIRMSYPDLVEEGGKYYVTETQKNLARVHEIEPGLLEGLWAQSENAQIATEGLILGAPDEGPVLPPGEIPMPSLPLFHQRDGTRADHGSRDLRAGFSLDLWLVLESLGAGQRIIDSRNSTGQGLVLETTERGTVRLAMSDGRSESSWDCDPGVLSAGRLHHVGIVVDGGPKIMTFIVDGALCDGGDRRQFGWGRFSTLLRHANGSPSLRVAPEMEGEIRRLRIYHRALRTSEIVANYQAGRLPV